MSTVTEPIILDATGKAIASAIDKVASAVRGGKGTCYGVLINGNESDPTAAVSYTDDAVGMTPAAMNYTSGAFDYGSWEDAFFMPRPCMLKSDGTVDYYLNPNDYSKKADGTASDIADASYDGNAMMEWGRNGKKIWIKFTPIGAKSGKIQIADTQIDDGFNDYAFHNCNGISASHFYTPIYNGSMDTNSKLRSLSGKTVSNKTTGTAEITAAKKNNAGTDELWNIECFADRLLINALLILMSKSLDAQTKFGQGLNTSGTEAINDGFSTGVHNAKGLFYGTNSGAAATYTNAVKVFGMENYYGFQWRRTNGLILRSGAIKYKLCYGKEDGSLVEGYNTTGENYKDAGTGVTGTSGNYIDQMKFTDDGMFPETLNGDSTHYYCDACWYNNSDNRFALFGGNSAHGATVGAFCVDLDYGVTSAGWIHGASVSCKPLA